MHKVSLKILLFGIFSVVLLLNIEKHPSTAATFSNSDEELPDRLNHIDTNQPLFLSREVSRLDSLNANSSRLSWTLVVFQSYRNEQWDIYLSDDSGGALLNVTNRSNSDVQPSLNRGGTKIVYSAEEEGQYEIAVIDLKTNHRVLLTNNNWSDANPRWSPDGSKIVFESQQFGQTDLFVMNADGSSLKRLTTNSEFDGMASWSPDGEFIIFSSRRSGGYRIYRIGANGQDLAQLNNIPFSFRPKWSPDGKKIAFDADPGGLGFQRLHTMNADGSDVQELSVISSEINDQIVNGWAPDGSSILYTSVSYILNQDRYYIKSAEIRYFEEYLSGNVPLFFGEFDFFADWQTIDNLPPNSKIVDLESIKPSAFPIGFRHSDSGGSGFHSFDLQVRQGLDGNWQNLAIEALNHTISFEDGIGGESYYFRTRSRDNAFNVSSWSLVPVKIIIESEPPVSEFTSQPDSVRNGYPTIFSWDGVDPGQSGIATFDVQYRAGDGAWQDLVVASAKNKAQLAINDLGKKYHFRIRAIDKAGNQADWLESSTTLTTYSWDVNGYAFDNTHTPVSGVQAKSIKYPNITTYGDESNRYKSYVIPFSSEYDISWFKTGYGETPTATFKIEDRAVANVILPPSDNLVSNWSFELDSFAGWDISLGSTFSVTSESRFAGHNGVSSFNPTYKLGDTKVFLPKAGDFIFANEVNGDFYYITVKNEITDVGPQYTEVDFWKSHQLRNEFEQAANLKFHMDGIPKVIVSPDGSIHVVALQRDPQSNYDLDLFHIYRDSEGSWHPPLKIASKVKRTLSSKTTETVSMHVDKENGLHVFWGYESPFRQLAYTYRAPDGNWGTEVAFNAESNQQLLFHTINLDRHGRLHVLFTASSEETQFQTLYTYKEVSNLSWVPFIPVTEKEYPNQAEEMVIGQDGSVNVFLRNGIDSSFFQKEIFEDGSIRTSPVIFDAANSIVVDRFGVTHMISYNSDPNIEGFEYANKTANGEWSNPNLLFKTNAHRAKLLVDRAGILHVAYLGGDYSDTFNYYQQRSLNGDWIPHVLIEDTYSSLSHDMVIDSQDQLHFIWSDLVNDGKDIGLLHKFVESSSYSAKNTISQVITIPANMQDPILSFVYRGAGLSVENSLYVEVDSATSNFSDAITTINGDWEHYWTNLSNFSGETVTVTLTHNQAQGAANTWLYLDEISVGSTNSDVFIQPDILNILKGDSGEISLSYGNHGGAAASNVVMTVTLPAELNFVSASVDPEINEHELIWRFSKLQPKSQDSIYVLIQPDVSQPLNSTLIAKVEIETQNNELEKSNNLSQVRINIQPHYIYLPIILH